MPKKKKAYDIIDDYYAKQRINVKIRNISLDKSRYDKAMLQPDMYSRRQEVYERFSIAMYNTKQEFIDRQEKINPDIPMSTVDKLWKEYQDRDKLIISGQYEDYRYSSYRENYLKAMKRSGMGLEVIKNVEALPLEKWKEIVNIPKASKDTAQDKLFPLLGGFHYGDQSLKFIRAATESIKEAFETLGVKYIDDIQSSKERKMAVARIKQMNMDSIESSEFIDNVLRTLPAYEKSVVKEVPFTESDRTETQMVVLGSVLKRGKVKTSKSGNRYIPFVGSTRTGTKNEKFVKALLEGYDIYK